MKKTVLIIICLVIFPFNVYAVTLKSALKLTFENNLELQAERKNLEVQKEVLNISKSDFLPTMTLTGKKNFEETNKLTNQSGGDASVTDVNTLSSSIKIQQTLLDGQGRSAEYEKSKFQAGHGCNAVIIYTSIFPQKNSIFSEWPSIT